MKRRVVAVSLVLVFIAFPALVSSQGLLPGVRGGVCSEGRPFALEIYAGYASDLGTAITDLMFVNSGDHIGLEYSTSHQLYLGAGLPFRVGRRSTLRLGGSLTFGGTAKVDSIDYNVTIARVARVYNADTTWGTLDAVLTHEMWSGVTALVGFRWDNWQSSFKTSEVNPAFTAFLSPDDKGDFVANAFVPLIGIVTRTGGFTLGVVGFPVVFGDMVDHANENFAALLIRERVNATFSRGYYVEFFLDTAVPMDAVLGGLAGNLSLFAKLNILDGRGNGNFAVRADNLDQDSYAVQWAFHRELFVVGGKVELPFDLSSLTSLLAR